MSDLNFISTCNELDEALEFLAVGFDWGYDDVQKTKGAIQKSNNDFYYGALQKVDGEIKICILFIKQGVDVSNMCSIINLSSWYACNTHRGLEAVIFLKKVIAALSGNVITVYTPSPQAAKIYKSLGFNEMPLKRYIFGIDKRRICFNARELMKDMKPISRPINFRQEFFVKKSTRERFGIPITTIDIYPRARADFFIPLFWLILFMLRERCIRICIYRKSQQKSLSKADWLIKSPNDLINYTSPVGSELEIL
jgi:hypothetical protein